MVRRGWLSDDGVWSILRRRDDTDAGGPKRVPVAELYRKDPSIDFDRARSSIGFDRARSSFGFERASWSFAFDRATSSIGFDRASWGFAFDRAMLLRAMSDERPGSAGRGAIEQPLRKRVFARSVYNSLFVRFSEFGFRRTCTQHRGTRTRFDPPRSWLGSSRIQRPLSNIHV